MVTNSTQHNEIRRLSEISFDYDSRSERFATEEELSSSYAHFSINKEGNAVDGGVPFAHLSKSNEVLLTNPECHVFVIGESGCGKTRRLVLPTIHASACSGRSMVISDPKGELYRETANELKVKGYNIKVLNLRNPEQGDRWNPFALIRNLINSSSKTERGRGEVMLMDICDRLSKRVDSKLDHFWGNTTKQLIQGAFRYLNREDVDDITFPAIYDTLRVFFDLTQSPSRTGDDDKSAFSDFYETIPNYTPEKNCLKALSIGSFDRTLQSIELTTEGALSYFVSQESLMDLFSGNSIDMHSLGKEKTAIYIILPDDTESMYEIATIFINQIYSTLLAEADSNPTGTLDNKVDFILDEFANFAPLGSVGSLLTAARSRGIRFILICQSLEQLDHKYGAYEAETLRSNCRVWIYMGCRNHSFLKRLEEQCGTYQYKYSRECVPLVSMTRLLHMEKGEVLVLNDREHPFMGILPDWSSYYRTEKESQKAELPVLEEEKEIPISEYHHSFDPFDDDFECDPEIPF